VRQASELLGVSASTLRRWADSGKVASLRTPGGQRRFSRDDLAALLPPARAGASAEAAVAQLEQDRKLALLFEATRAVTSSLVLEDVLELVTRTTAEVMGTFAADIFDYSAADNAMIASGTGPWTSRRRTRTTLVSASPWTSAPATTPASMSPD